MKKIFFILLIILLAGCIQDEPFCGTSTYDSCETNSDCIDAGCSSQICQSKNAEQTFTTCEFRPCYEPNIYGVECKCIENKCQWSK